MSDEPLDDDREFDFAGPSPGRSQVPPVRKLFYPPIYRTISPPLPTALPCDLACVHCGYNLRTLSPHGICPECGHVIMDSIPLSWRQRKMAVDASPPATVRIDLLCQNCGVNLRGSAGDGNCPACGVPVAESLPLPPDACADDSEASLEVTDDPLAPDPPARAVMPPVYRRVYPPRYRPVEVDADSGAPGKVALELDLPPEIASHLPCRQCSKDLRGLSPAGKCPECGLPIAESLARPVRSPQDLDRAAYREFYPRINEATRALLISTGVFLLLVSICVLPSIFDPAQADSESFPLDQCALVIAPLFIALLIVVLKR